MIEEQVRKDSQAELVNKELSEQDFEVLSGSSQPDPWIFPSGTDGIGDYSAFHDV